MIQKIFWISCLCLQLITTHAQLDLPNASYTPQHVSKRPQVNASPIPLQQQQQQQQQAPLPPPQSPQQPPNSNSNNNNNYNDDYEFVQPQPPQQQPQYPLPPSQFQPPQLPYPYHNFLPPNVPLRPVIQINNRLLPSYNNNNNNNNNVNGTRPSVFLNVFGRHDNSFGPGSFGHDYIGRLGPPQGPGFPFPINLGYQPSQNLVSPQPSTVTPSSQQSESRDTALPPPPNGQLPYQPSNYQSLPPLPPNLSNFDPNGPIRHTINFQNFQPFAPNLGRFDFGHNVAPPQTIEQNLHVTGPTVDNEGLVPPSNPVVGFYGPPPNLGLFSYPTFAPGYTYPGTRYSNQGPGPSTEQVETQGINPK